MRKLLFLLFVTAGSLFSQNSRSSISGYITDKSTGLPLADVNVSISGLNKTAISDPQGYYKIISLPEGNHKITLSLIGYENISVEIQTGDSTHTNYDAALTQRIYSTETINIETERIPDRDILISLFKEYFIGKIPFENCSITNDSVIKITRIKPDIYEFNTSSDIIIENNTLGYSLKGMLEYFILNTSTGISVSSFDPVFTEMSTDDPAVRLEWEANRSLAYRGSLKHFLLSLYNNSVFEEGYDLYLSKTGTSLLKKVSNINSLVIHEGNAGNLNFSGFLIVRYGTQISAIKLKRPYLLLQEDYSRVLPFLEVSGSFVSKGIAWLLPQSYNPSEIKPPVSGYNELHVMLTRFKDSLYQFKGSNMQKIKDSLLIETMKHPEDIYLKFRYGVSLEECCFLSAASVYDNLIEEDSSLAEAYFRLGMIKAEEFNEYNGSVKRITETGETSIELAYNHLYRADETITRSMKFASLPLFEEAEMFLKKAIENNPAIDDYYLELAFLYEDNLNLEAAEKVLKKLCSMNAYNKNAHLYLGILDFRAARYKEAYRHFNIALSLMDRDEKNDFIYYSVRILLEPVLGQKLNEMNDVDFTQLVNKFWDSEDPFLLTTYNERILEHYCRVAYANLRFGSNSSRNSGWKTDRGEILLRYGMPEHRTRFRPFIEQNLQYGLRNFTKTELWYYGGMFFSFSDQGLDREYKLTTRSLDHTRSQANFDSRAYADNLKKTNFEKYTYKSPGPVLACPLRVYQFKSHGNKRSRSADVYLCLSLPGKDSLQATEDNFKAGVYCFDQGHSQIFNKTYTFNTRDGNPDIPRSDTSDNSRLVSELNLDKGRINIAAEVLRSRDNASFSKHFHFDVRDFEQDELMISDVIISKDLIFGSGSQKAINRNGIWILPDPSMSFSNRDKVHIYYEVYNLSRDIIGVNNYDQEVIIRKKDDNSNGLLGRLADGIISLVKDDKIEAITLDTRIISHSKNQQICFETSFASLSPGTYEMKILFRDKLTGKMCESVEEFNILEN